MPLFCLTSLSVTEAWNYLDTSLPVPAANAINTNIFTTNTNIFLPRLGLVVNIFSLCQRWRGHLAMHSHQELPRLQLLLGQEGDCLHGGGVQSQGQLLREEQLWRLLQQQIQQLRQIWQIWQRQTLQLRVCQNIWGHCCHWQCCGWKKYWG